MIAPANNGNGGQEAGSFFNDPHHLRADARLASALISLGVISPERAKSLLRKAVELAEDCAEAKNSRAFCSLMRTVTDIVKLEQTERQIQAARPVRDESSIDAEYSRDDLLAKLEKRASQMPPSN